MAMYRYVKGVPRQRRIPHAFSFLFIGAGIMLLGWTLWPIITFSVINEPLFASIATPLSDTVSVGIKPEGSAGPISNRSNNNTDYTDVNTWFPGKPQKKIVTPINTYTLSIPRLRIENATVIIAGDDLSEGLVHYGGTPLPGTYGNTVIFGHSTLPQFYDPKKYKTIFSLLPTLSIGDQIFILYDGLTYTYTVFDMVVVEPTDLSPLEQRFDDAYVTLVTCVPPGTYWKRLNVKAKLEKRV